ncbi:MAG: hypothetical protein M3N24_04765 [Actinomycetota bacterium]|nr:hypothetical protein [Actinomycetota bacterium]
MSTDQLTRTDRASSNPRQTLRVDLRQHLGGLLLVALLGALFAAFFAGLYFVNNYRFPIGWDTARYLFHMNFIAERGFGTEIPHLLPLAESVTANRPGFPVLALSLSNLFATSNFRVAAAIPIAGAVATALAIGGFGSAALGLKRWEMVVVTVIGGTSATVIRLLAPETYTDNLLAASICVAALIPVIAVVQRGTSFVPAAVLLGIAGVIHPASFVIVAAALGVTALLYVPSSWRSWRSGEAPLLATPAGRLGAVVSGSGILAAVGLFGLTSGGPDVRGVYREELEKKFREDLPLYRLPLTLPLAGVGAAAVAASGPANGEASSRRRFTLTLSLSWGGIAALGILAFFLGRDLPPHRFIALFLLLPLLVGVGVLALGRILASGTAVAVGVIGVVLTTGTLAFLGYRDFYVTIPQERGVRWMDKGKIDDALTAGRYLDMVRVPENAPVVFVIDDHGPNPVVSVSQQTYVIAANLRPDRVEQAEFYFGDPERYLEGRPTFRPGRPLYNQMSALLWRDIRPLIQRKPVALMLASYNPNYLETVNRHPELRTINNTMVLNGPPPPRSKLRQSIPASGPLRVLGLVVVTLLVLSLAGAGWAIALFPGGVRSREVLAAAPAVGIALVVAGGLLLDRTGIRLTGLAAAATPVVVAVAGWVFAARRLVRTPGLFTAD